MCFCMLQEIDYELEGKNADRFRVNFQNTPWIKVSNVQESKPEAPSPLHLEVSSNTLCIYGAS